jgi:hypothetical protein
VRYGLDRAGSVQVQFAGTCECVNEPSGYIKCGEYLDSFSRTLLLGVSKDVIILIITSYNFWKHRISIELVMGTVFVLCQRGTEF